MPRTYTLAELEAEPVLYNSNLGSYTNFVNLLDLAAITVPAGTRSDGLPLEPHLHRPRRRRWVPRRHRQRR